MFRGRTEINDVGSFDVRKESILLGFVEAVNFIDEDDGAIAGFGFQFGSGHDFLDFLDAGQDRAERDEAGFGEPRNQTSESGFPAAGGAPEKHGAEMVRFDLNAERFAGAEEFLLADEFVKRAWAHALGERL